MQVRARFVQETLLLTTAADQCMEQSRSAVVGIKSRGGAGSSNFQMETSNGGENGCTEFHFCPEKGIFSHKFCIFVRKFTNQKLG